MVGLGLVVLLPVPSAAQCTGCALPSFARAGRLQAPVSGENLAIVSGDWDGDAVPDVALAGNSGITVMLGDGSLRLASPVYTALPPAVSPDDRRSLVVADFNLDGRPDLATVNPSSGFPDDDSLAVLLNTGGGSFAAPLIIPVGANPWGVVAGDFNRDGAPDLVSVNRGGRSLTFLPGNGDGTFGTAVTTSLLVDELAAIAAADIDGDLKLDVAVTSTLSNSMRWYRGNGLGGFTSGGSGLLGGFPQSVDLGDLNADGRPDLVAANRLDGTVTVFLNTGAGFGGSTTYLVASDPWWVRIGRADADADADLVVAASGSHEIDVLLNNGSGAFPASTRVRESYYPRAAIVVDADRNARPDLAIVSGQLVGVGVVVLPGDGVGGFGPRMVSPGTGDRSIAVADFDGGWPDLVTLDQSTDRLSFLSGAGDGTFAPPATFTTGLVSPRGLGVGDFDSNGTADVVVGGPGSTVALLLGNGSGGFASTSVSGTATGSSRYHIAVGDFDRDGNLDFTRITGTSVTTQYGNGSGSFVAERSTSIGGTLSDLVVLDFNRDGILDLAVSLTSTDAVVLLQGLGDRSDPPFTRLSPDLLTASTPTGLAAGDVNKDGVTDLVVSQMGSTPVGRLGYFPGLPASSPPFFATREDYDLDAATALRPDGVALADVNADGWLDALVACQGSPPGIGASVRVLTGTGSLTPGSAFGAADSWAVAQRSPSVIEVADFNLDGKPDFATGEAEFGLENRVAVVLNSNCESRRLRVIRQPSQCNTVSMAFGQQPAVQIEDDGTNPVQCEVQPVTASIIGGPGGTLSGTNPLAPTSGVADWSTAATPMSIDAAGVKFQLGFAHPAAGPTFSGTFSISPSQAITGPAGICRDSGATFTAAPDFDAYFWYVDGSGPVGWAPSLTIAPYALPAGSHTVRVDARPGTCPLRSVLHPFDVYAELSSVTVAPAGNVSVCSTCTGATLTASETGGGAVLRKWGYRTLSGGETIFFPGETGASYIIDGSDFPGQGTYYVVEESTPQCGVPTFSNEVEVQVTASTISDDLVPVFTVRSTSQENLLEWIYPSGYDTVAIRYNTASTWLGCVPPTKENGAPAVIPDQTGTAGEKGVYTHGALTPLTNGQTYCYAMFAKTGTSPDKYSTNGREVKGRPFDTSGPVKWAFSVGMSTMSPPGLGAGMLHVVCNDQFLYAIQKGAAGGSWPPGFRPFLATGPSQTRPASVPITVGPASHVIYLGSQAPLGNNALAVNADTGMGLWGHALGAPVVGGPGGIFTSFGGSMDAVFFGTQNGGLPSALFALNPSTGAVLPGWPYTGEPGNRIGPIYSRPAVDYAGDRIFFTSYHNSSGTDVAWCVDLATATRCPGWTVGTPYNHVAANPTLRGNRLYVSPIAVTDGLLRALDADTGVNQWKSLFDPREGAIKLWVVADVLSNDLYLSTSNAVWAIVDIGSDWAQKWRVGVSNPSQPVFYAGTGRVYVGTANAQLLVLKALDGSNFVPPIDLAEPGFTGIAGAPTVDQAGGFVYLGSEWGVVYAVKIP